MQSCPILFDFGNNSQGLLEENIFLGFVIDSVAMTVTLAAEKKEKLLNMIEAILSKTEISIRELATIIGKFVSSFPGSLYGPLYYRTLEQDKSDALKRNRGNYESMMQISENGKLELLWWRDNIPSMNAPIQWPPITSEMSTDASGKIGWGGKYTRYITYWGCMDTGTGRSAYQCQGNACHTIWSSIFHRNPERAACSSVV